LSSEAEEDPVEEEEETDGAVEICKQGFPETKRMIDKN
jgi:hypothetical protein